MPGDVPTPGPALTRVPSPSALPILTRVVRTAKPPVKRAPPTAPRGKIRTWSLIGGSVTLRCRGSVVSLVAASPSAGYTGKVGASGPTVVLVSFRNDADRSEFHGGCSGGDPVATIREHRGHTIG